MKYEKIKLLKNKIFFTVEDVSAAFGIARRSALVLCARYAVRGVFIRLKNNFYVLDQRWDSYDRDDFMKIANFLQVPSYVSFLTALAFYEVTTQVPRGRIESASTKRSVRFNARGEEFVFYKLRREYYFDFKKSDGLFIAAPEKAFVDCLYMSSLGRYALDIDALDLKKLDKAKVKKVMSVFPDKTKRKAAELCGI